MRILRVLITLLAMLAMAGHPASAAWGCQETVRAAAAEATPVSPSAELSNHAIVLDMDMCCPGRHGKATQSVCCASVCLPPSLTTLAQMHGTRTVKLRGPLADTPRRSVRPILLQRPPIFIDRAADPRPL